MYFSYKNIHEQSAVRMAGCPSNDLTLKRGKFAEMIQFVCSTKCRRAFILPYFEARIGIQPVALIFMKVIQEFQCRYSEGVVFSRIEDVIPSVCV
jgi:hypothetical protein